MKNQSQKIVNIFILAILLVACDKNVYYNIPEDRKPLIKDNDTLVYPDNSGDIDSLSIRMKIDYTVHDKRYYHQRVLISYFTMAKGKRTANLLLSIQQGPTGASISSGGNYFPDTEEKYKLTTSYPIGNEQLEEVYKLNLDFALWGNPLPNDVVEVYYTPQYGIVQYSYFDGRTCKLNLTN